MDHVCRLPGIALERYVVLRVDGGVHPTEENIRDTIRSRNSLILHMMLNMKDVDIHLDYDGEIVEADDAYVLHLLQSYGYIFRAYYLLDGKKGKYLCQYFIYGYPINHLSKEFVVRLACMYGHSAIVERLLPDIPDILVDELYKITKDKEIKKLLKPNKWFIC